MEASEMKPRNIFEQILFGQIAINDNIVALARNIEVLNERIDDIMGVFTTNATIDDNKSILSNE